MQDWQWNCHGGRWALQEWSVGIGVGGGVSSCILNSLPQFSSVGEHLPVRGSQTLMRALPPTQFGQTTLDGGCHDGFDVDFAFAVLSGGLQICCRLSFTVELFLSVFVFYRVYCWVKGTTSRVAQPPSRKLLYRMVYHLTFLYHTNRLYCKNSSKLTMTCGVPQGIVLGPLLFLKYSSMICQMLLNFLHYCLPRTPNFNFHLQIYKI